ncbi:MAG: mechanosensitive ion channel family protein [Candidatus Micrarchaeia archaeon]
MKERQIKRTALFNIVLLLIGSAILISIFYAVLDFLNVNKDLKAWIFAALTIVFGVGITWLMAKIIKEYVIVNGIKQEADTISMFFSIIAYSVIALVALYLVHVNVTGLLVSAGFLGIVLGLAAQSTLGNVFSGIAMILAKPLEPGDYITIETWQYNKMPSTYPHEEFVPGYSGTVEKIGLLYTELLDDSNEPIYVPNGILNQALLINHRRAAIHTLRFRVELNKQVPFDEVEQIIQSVLVKYGIGKESALNVEHISENAYGLAILLNSNKSNISLRKVKSEILRGILSYSIKAGRHAKSKQSGA